MSILALTIIAAFGIFYATSGTRPHLDPVPHIKPVTPEEYNAGGRYADKLTSGMFITNFAVSNFVQGLFMIDAFVWFRFNPFVFSLDTVKQFTFDKGKILQKEFIESIKIDKELFVRYRVQFEIKSNLNFKYFPLDNHCIYMVLKNDLFSPTEVILTSSFSTAWFGDNAVSLNWIYGEPASDFGYIESTLDTQNKDITVYTSAAGTFFDFKRATLREAVIVIVPFVSLLFIILGSLLMALTSFQAIIIAILTLIAMIMYRTIINQMAPQTSYFMLSDCIFLLVLGCVSLVMIAEIGNALYKNEEQEWVATLRGGVCTLVSTVFLVGWFYLLYMW